MGGLLWQQAGPLPAPDVEGPAENVVCDGVLCASAIPFLQVMCVPRSSALPRGALFGMTGA